MIKNEKINSINKFFIDIRRVSNMLFSKLVNANFDNNLEFSKVIKDKTETFKWLSNFRFPLYKPGNIYIVDFIEKILGEYKNNLNKLLKKSKLKKLIYEECDSIIAIYKNMLDGREPKAYDIMQQMMLCIDSYILNAFYNEKNIYGINSFYRVRSNDKQEPFNEYDMFHLPYAESGKGSVSRFCEKGTICLYVSSSFDSYLSPWYECKCPSIFSIAKFSADRDYIAHVRLIDLTTNYLQTFKRTELEYIDEKKIYKYLVTTPIRMACSVISNGEDDRGQVPEYMFSQLLMRWVKNSNQYLGIAYTSNEYYGAQRNYSSINVALPLKNPDENGHDKVLKRIFSIGNNATKIIDINIRAMLREKFADRLVELENKYFGLRNCYQTESYNMQCRDLIECIGNTLSYIKYEINKDRNSSIPQHFFKNIQQFVMLMVYKIKDYDDILSLERDAFIQKTGCLINIDPNAYAEYQHKHKQYKVYFLDFMNFFENVAHFECMLNVFISNGFRVKWQN